MFDESLLSAPIPGMSLTTEPGNRPWENPPQLSTVEEAIEYYSSRLLDPENAEVVLDPLVQEISVESMVDVITTSSVMNGIHSLDISFLVAPVVREIIKYVADANSVEYKESYTKGATERQMPLHEARKIVKEIAEEQLRESGFRDNPQEFMMQKMLETPKAAIEQEPTAPTGPRGLMARPAKEMGV
jgi:hypothetical protein